VGTAIKVLVNATRRTVDPTSTRTSPNDIDAHAERLGDGAYPWSRYVLFNCALTENEVVLPRDETMWERTYTFVYQANALYRGQDPIKENVVQKLMSEPRRPTFAIGNVSAAERRSLHRGGGAPWSDTAAGAPSMVSTVGDKGKRSTFRPLSTAPKTRAQHQEVSGVKTKARVADASQEEEKEEKVDKKKERVATRKQPPTDTGPERKAKSPRNNPPSL
jgi:hypothetical protein